MLDFEVIDHFGADIFVSCHGVTHAITECGATHFAAGGAAGTFGLIDFEVDPCVILCPHNLEERSEASCGLPAAANHIPHIFGVHLESKQYSHFIDSAVAANVFRMVDDGADDVFDEFLIAVLFSHIIIKDNKFSKKLSCRQQSSFVMSLAEVDHFVNHLYSESSKFSETS